MVFDTNHYTAAQHEAYQLLKTDHDCIESTYVCVYIHSTWFHRRNITNKQSYLSFPLVQQCTISWLF